MSADDRHCMEMRNVKGHLSIWGNKPEPGPTGCFDADKLTPAYQLLCMPDVDNQHCAVAAVPYQINSGHCMVEHIYHN